MGRTKGSKNGVSTTPGYTAIGQKAQGINYQRDPRFAQDYSAADKGLAKRLAAQRKANVSSSAAQINANIDAVKARLAEQKQTLARQIYRQKLMERAQRAAGKKIASEKVAESAKGGTNDWQRMANATASMNPLARDLSQGKIQYANTAGEINKLTPKKWAHHSYIDADKTTEKYKAKTKAKARAFNKLYKKRKKAKKGIKALRKYRGTPKPWKN